MKKYLRYLWYIVRHKWFVLLGCWNYGLLWRGITHDWSKFLPSEFIPYAQHFYGPDEYKGSPKGKYKFNFAWLLHQKRNSHHWQWWLLPLDSGTTSLFPMSNDDLLEMIADWDGAGRAINGKVDTLSWYQANKDKMTLHPTTRECIEFCLGARSSAVKISSN